MIKVVVDSDIFIDLLRTKKGELPILFEFQEKQDIELYLSTVTVMEVFSGKSSKSEEISLLALMESFTVIPLTFEIAKLAGELKRDHKNPGLVSDLIIAATAVSIGAQLTTRNRRHFQGFKNLKFFSGYGVLSGKE